MVGCGTPRIQYFIKPLEDISRVTVSTRPVELFSADKSISVKGLWLEAPDTIDWVDFDSDYRKAFLRYSLSSSYKNGNEIIVAFDLKENKVIWAKKSNAKSGWITDDYLGINLGSIYHLSFQTGDTIAYDYKFNTGVWLEKGNFRIISVSNAFEIAEARAGKAGSEAAANLTAALTGQRSTYSSYSSSTITIPDPKQTLIAMDITSGDTIWTRAVFLADEPSWHCSNENNYYIVARGLEMVDINSGEGWFVTGNEFAGREGMTLVEEKFASYVIKTIAESINKMQQQKFNGSGEHLILNYSTGQCSSPIFKENLVYFHQNNFLTCCAESSGTIKWKTPLEKTPGKVSIRFAGSNILIIYHGWKFFYKYGTRVAYSGQPQVILLDKDTGEVIMSYFTDKKHAIYDCLITEQSIFLLSINKIYQFNHNLQLLAEIPNIGYGDFIRFMIEPDNTVLIRSTEGVLALTEMPIGVKWWLKLNLMNINPKHARGTIHDFWQSDVYHFIDGEKITFAGRPTPWKEFVKTKIAQNYYTAFHFSKNYLWLQTLDSYVCIDYEKGEKVLRIPVFNHSTAFLQPSGWFHYTNGRKHLALDFNEP
ncbi:MAG: hypothetical protein HQ568_02975 [Calditrichaeota bacterium]|nr:hypothetical protein [Calditrichota bacterium]